MMIASGLPRRPRQKRRPCRKAADFALADGLQAELHDLVVGAAGAETKQTRGGAGFQLGGERDQLVEQAVVVDKFGRAPHFLSDLREALLDTADRREKPLRLRQAEQRERAIGFQLDDTLDQRPSSLRAEP